MSGGILPPIRDILPGFLHDYPAIHQSAASPSPHMLPNSPCNSSPGVKTDPDALRSPSEHGRSLFPVKYGNSSASVSSLIPISSAQLTSSSSKGQSLTLASTEGPRLKRTRTPSSEASGTSDNSGTGQQSESDGDVQEHRAPSKKRRREEKKHACPYCRKLFHRPVSLGVHINTHTGEKPYTCPFPHCSREFNVNSNMRRHYRTHFTPGSVDMSELTYSSADERFYVHAATTTTPNTVRGRYGPIPSYIPPVPSVSYGASTPSHQIASYSGSNSHNQSAYGALPVSYVPILYHHRSAGVPLEVKQSPRLPSNEDRGEISVGRLKPASNWSRVSHRKENSEDDGFDEDDGDVDEGSDDD